jgi:hypothetical protein
MAVSSERTRAQIELTINIITHAAQRPRPAGRRARTRSRRCRSLVPTGEREASSASGAGALRCQRQQTRFGRSCRPFALAVKELSAYDAGDDHLRAAFREVARAGMSLYIEGNTGGFAGVKERIFMDALRDLEETREQHKKGHRGLGLQPPETERTRG